MITQIHINRLTPSCVTRARGEEAAKKLYAHSGTKPVEVDLSGIEMISLSFLDGLLFSFCKSSNKKRIIFYIDSPDTENKLARIAGMRHITIHYHYRGQEVRPVEPRPPHTDS